jgi:hypothetical protein
VASAEAGMSSTLADILAELELSHLADVLAEPALKAEGMHQMCRRAADDRVGFLQELKDCGVANLAQRQKLTNKLTKLAKQQVVSDFAGAAAAAIAAGEGSAPLIVQSTYGMANQLRVLLSYHAYAQSVGRNLVMIWHKHAACPGSFRDCFAPIDGCVVVDSLRELASLRPEWRHLAALPQDAIGSTAFTHPAIEGTPLEASMWAPLRPNAHVASLVAARLAELGDGPFAACHVRRTYIPL